MADVVLRPMQPGEVEKLVNITSETGFFYREEVEVAHEVLSEAETKGRESGYLVNVAVQGEEPVGYVCFGPTPLTNGTWDIYWLAVSPRCQHQGIGKRLMKSAEEHIFECKGRLIVLETSSRPLYKPTREFHMSLHYKEVACIPDFYDVGDSCVIFSKTLTVGDNYEMPP